MPYTKAEIAKELKVSVDVVHYHIKLLKAEPCYTGPGGRKYYSGETFSMLSGFAQISTESDAEFKVYHPVYITTEYRIYDSKINRAADKNRKREKDRNEVKGGSQETGRDLP